jgi:hypothetical protein
MLKSYAKMKFLPALGAFLLLFLIAGCNQDSIFDDISWETAPTQPKIKGSASKIVQADLGAGNKLYIANGRLWEYDLQSGSSWNRSSGPGGFVADVASTVSNGEGALYALTIDGASTRVWKTKDGTDWTQISPPSASDDYHFLQNIFGAGDTLFAAGRKNASDYAIHYFRQQDWGSGFARLEETNDAILTGAGVTGLNYYLATLGNGIYKASFPSSGAPNVESVSGLPSGVIAGFLQAAPDTIIGISRSGHVFRIKSSVVENTGASLGGTYTGALALMDSPNPQPDPNGGNFDKLLLLGFKGSNSSYRHGYVEVQFNNANRTHETTARIPGANQPTSIAYDSQQKDQQYTSSLRRYPVTALWVLQNPDRASPSVIFAATSNEGVYSYRYRSGGGWQWNHEE